MSMTKLVPSVSSSDTKLEKKLSKETFFAQSHFNSPTWEIFEQRVAECTEAVMEDLKRKQHRHLQVRDRLCTFKDETGDDVQLGKENYAFFLSRESRVVNVRVYVGLSSYARRAKRQKLADDPEKHDKEVAPQAKKSTQLEGAMKERIEAFFVEKGLPNESAAALGFEYKSYSIVCVCPTKIEVRCWAAKTQALDPFISHFESCSHLQAKLPAPVKANLLKEKEARKEAKKAAEKAKDEEAAKQREEDAKKKAEQQEQELQKRAAFWQQVCKKRVDKN